MTFVKGCIRRQIVWLIEMIAVVILCFILIFHMWEVNFSVLLENQGDAIGLATQAQDYISGMERNQFLAMPFGADEIEALNGSWLHLFWLRLIALFCDSFGTAGNILYLTGYVLAAVCMYVTLKIMRIQNAIAAALSVIFAFLPYHHLRGEQHIYLGMYYMVPLICLVIVWMLEGRIRLAKRMEVKEKQRLIFSLVIALFLALSDTYYMVFACILLVFAGLAGSIQRKDNGHIVAAVMLCIVMLSVTGLGNISYISRIMSGQQIDVEIAGRGLDDLERYGLRIAQLLLPVQNHRIDFLAKIRADYEASVLQNETETATLGATVSFGFCFSLFVTLACSGRTKIKEEIKRLGRLNIICVLIAGIGGFNVFAGMIFSGIRCYNRFSIFIAVFSIMVLAVLLQHCYRRIKEKKENRRLFFGGLSMLMLLALYDQTTSFDREKYQENLFLDANIRDMVWQIEEIVPENSMIFMMPVLAEKEDAFLYQMRSYEQQWPVIYSETLRWSATQNPIGVIGEKNQNRKWKKRIAEMPMDEMLLNVGVVGFEGIWLDANGYSEAEFPEVKEKLEACLGEPVLVSLSGCQYYYSLAVFVEEAKNNVTDDIWDQMRMSSLELGN